MFYKYKHKYNPKIDFQFIYYLNPKLNMKENYYELKGIFNENKKAISEQGIQFKILLITYRYLKNKRIIKLKHFLYLEKILNFEVNNLIELKKLTFNKNHIYNAIKVFRYIVENEMFGKMSLEIASIIFNVILVKNNYIPVVFFERIREFLKQKIIEGKSNEYIYLLIDANNKYTERYMKKFKKTTKSKIIKLILKEKEMLEKLDVKKVWLFGSFVRNQSNAYSDVDLYVDAKQEIVEQLDEYLTKKLKRSVGVQIVNNINERFSDNGLKERELIYEKL